MGHVGARGLQSTRLKAGCPHPADQSLQFEAREGRYSSIRSPHGTGWRRPRRLVQTFPVSMRTSPPPRPFRRRSQQRHDLVPCDAAKAAMKSPAPSVSILTSSLRLCASAWELETGNSFPEGWVPSPGVVHEARFKLETENFNLPSYRGSRAWTIGVRASAWRIMPRSFGCTPSTVPSRSNPSSRLPGTRWSPFMPAF
jgi:hypothetical protein